MDSYKYIRHSKNDLFVKTLKFLDEIVVNFVGKPFLNIDDLSLENLSTFLVSILKNYKEGHISHMMLKNITDGIEELIFEKYGPEYPELPDSDERSVGLEALSHIMESSSLLQFTTFPEDASFFIQCLEESKNQSESINKKMRKYVENLEGIKRYEDGLKKGYLTRIKEKSIDSKDPSEKKRELIATYIDSTGATHKVEQDQSGLSINILWTEGDCKWLPCSH